MHALLGLVTGLYLGVTSTNPAPVLFTPGGVSVTVSASFKGPLSPWAAYAYVPGSQVQLVQFGGSFTLWRKK